jgi:hypothetical protein
MIQIIPSGVMNWKKWNSAIAPAISVLAVDECHKLDRLSQIKSTNNSKSLAYRSSSLIG